MGSNREILEKAGWLYRGNQRNGINLTYFWDHPEHQKEDGSWWTQTEALAKQQQLAREARAVRRANGNR